MSRFLDISPLVYITYEQCENLARAMAERLKKDRK